MLDEDEFWKAIADTDFTTPEPVKHKIYYDAKGNIIDFTIEDRKDSGDYIEVDQQTFLSAQMGKYKIKNGELINMALSNIDALYLEKSKEGKFKTLKNNMLILADGSITDRDYYVSK